MEIFGGRKKKSAVWKIELPDEDPRTIDIDLRTVMLWTSMVFQLKPLSWLHSI